MRLSIIVPALNEARNLPDVIDETRRLGESEIVVVDGGSEDDTWDRAASADVRVRSPRGRAAQMNAGADAATGDVLLFLHADCRLHRRAFEAVRTTMAAGFVGGCFPMTIEAPGWGYRLVENSVNFRTRMWFWAYGDQGFFVTRETFNRLQGFPDVPLMEDVVFAERLRRTRRWVVANAPIRVSARRWERYGLWTQTLRNLTLITKYRLGVPPERLSAYYSDEPR